MALRFVWKSNGEVVVDQVEALGLRVRRAREVLEDFGEHMLNTSLPENFARGGRPTRWAGSPWAQGRNVQSESGRLLRSIQAHAGATKLVLGTNLAYAAQRQFGGELVPTKSRALAVPMPGVPRSMRRPRRWGDRLRFIPSKGGGDTVGVLAAQEGRGKRKRWRAKFVLRTRVEQTARPFLLFQDEDVAYVSKRLVAFVTGEAR